ncbi:MAG: NAD(P)-dependent oxidoreductase [Planctomycetaceae bacterium]|nr:NAD(P)-dependent oxidoreductase [Planctomycetaceae bacterium]
MTVLVTGANGFVGTAVCSMLEKRGTPFIGLVRKNALHARMCVGDLSSPEGLPHRNFQVATAVVHCAAELPDGERTDFTKNVTITENLLNALGKNVEIFVLLSSVSVYDPCDVTLEYDLTEDADELAQSGYGYSKLEQERLVTDWCQTHGVRFVILRASSIYGVGCRPTTLLPRICLAAVKNLPIELFAPANYRQNFVCVKDVAGIACDALNRTGVRGVFNLFSDDTFSAVALANKVVSSTGSTSNIVERESNKMVPVVRFDNSRLHQTFQPEFARFESEIRAYCNDLASTAMLKEST